MDKVYHQTSIEYKFIRSLSNTLDLQYEEYKKQIINIILEELNNEYKNNENNKNNKNNEK